MKGLIFNSIRAQITAATTVLIVALISLVVSVWAKTESELVRQQKFAEAQLFSNILANNWANEIGEQNWSQIRLDGDLLMKKNKEILYLFVSDSSKGNQIIVSSSPEFQDKYVPDVVPPDVTNTAWKLSRNYRTKETVVLRDIQFASMMRAKRGDRILEVAASINTPIGTEIGTVRIGMSLRQVDVAVKHAVIQALSVGAVGLVVGLICANILAKRLSDRIQKLQLSAARIAAGDLYHRATVDSIDELGSLALSFNEMSAALQGSFYKLRRTLDTFEMFVPDEFLSVIAPQGIENIQVGVASHQTMTILFCDIRGYTAMSEMMTPLETFTFLNDYLACMGKAINQAGGFIDKYIGDAIMALFDDDETDCALHAAIMMHDMLDKFNYKRQQQGLPTIAVGIGIHRGEVVMGTVGFTSRIESTVIGDAVNLTSRLEGLTKHYNCEILLTESVVSGLSNPNIFSFHLVDASVKVKGKEESIAIYQLNI